MAGSKTIDIHGKVKYIHAVNFNKYGTWTIVLYPDAKSIDVLRDLQAEGLKNVMKKDDDGYYMQFKRDPEKEINGKKVAFAAPKVVDIDGKPMDGRTIGWGSDVTARMECYKYGGRNGIARGVALRWDAVKVLNLVKFELDQSDWSESDKEEVRKLADAPEPEPW